MWCSPTGGSSWPRLPISVIRRWKRERRFLFYGYQGDRRPETAELVVRRRHLGTASNDLGFARTPHGYVPIVSDYDQRTLQGGQFLVKLRTAYSEQVVAEVTRRLRGTARRTVEGHLVKIQVRY
jgi:hypothetical protein